jgi:transposase
MRCRDAHAGAQSLAAGVTVADVRASIEAVSRIRRTDRPRPATDSDHLDRHPGLRAQRELLTTIPGIGEATAAVLIAELFDKRYASARQAAAFAAWSPPRRIRHPARAQSLIEDRPRASAESALHAGVAALRWNPTIRAVRARLHAGQTAMVIIGAAMRKLIHLAYGVLKSGRAYEPTCAHLDSQYGISALTKLGLPFLWARKCVMDAIDRHAGPIVAAERY